MEIWNAPTLFPLVIDYPEDYLPSSFTPADLLLVFGEYKGIIELVPDIARLSGARAVIAPIDSEAWLPRGLCAAARGRLPEQCPRCHLPRHVFNLLFSTFGV